MNFLRNTGLLLSILCAIFANATKPTMCLKALLHYVPEKQIDFFYYFNAKGEDQKGGAVIGTHSVDLIYYHYENPKVYGYRQVNSSYKTEERILGSTPLHYAVDESIFRDSPTKRSIGTLLNDFVLIATKSRVSILAPTELIHPERNSPNSPSLFEWGAYIPQEPIVEMKVVIKDEFFNSDQPFAARKHSHSASNYTWYWPVIVYLKLESGNTIKLNLKDPQNPKSKPVG